MARRSEIGDLGLSESTTTNTEIAIKLFNHKELTPNACPLARKKDGSSFTSDLSCSASAARLGVNP